MDRLRIKEHAKPKVKAPIFVEGLPGIGHVGKLAAQHIVESGKAALWLTIHSVDFPPQVAVGEDGIIRLLKVEVWTIPAKGKSAPLVVMTGDAQPLTSQGQHELVEAVLDRIEPLGCKSIYTLGGYGTGTRVEKPEVLAAATDKATVVRLKKLGIRLPGDDTPGGGIIGASGLFLGLGALRGMSGACLMGETNGYLVDPKAARAVLTALGKAVGRDFGTADLEKRAADLDRITAQLSEAMSTPQREGTEHYIG
ncbi:MAG: proteasome assembly chaperone family protein [Candidatus Thermoplasmatota archaeon]